MRPSEAKVVGVWKLRRDKQFKGPLNLASNLAFNLALDLAFNLHFTCIQPCTKLITDHRLLTTASHVSLNTGIPFFKFSSLVRTTLSPGYRMWSPGVAGVAEL